MKPISLKQLFLSILERRDEDTMWSGFMTVISGKSSRLVLVKELQDRHIYLCSKGEEHVFIMLDHAMNDKCEMANEHIGEGCSYPCYHTSASRRKSPVYELVSYMEAFSEHCEVAKDKIAGLLLTDSNIVNSVDMERGWRRLNVKVRMSLENLTENLRKISCDDIVLSSDVASFLESVSDAEPSSYDRKKYNSKFVEETDGEGRSVISDEEFESPPKRVDIRKWVEDDPDFYDEYPGGKKVLSIPKVEVYRRESNPRRALMELTGLEEVKRKIEELSTFACYNALMAPLTLSSSQDINLHAIFTGSVGCGKTTVARLYASLLYDIGLLSTGQVVIADRSSFIDKYWGHAESVVGKILKLAQGGVLFIDEAYLLATNDDKDPGRIVIQMLLDILADDKNRDIAIVLAGYPDKMHELLSVNPGLTSRFPNVFTFADFNVSELRTIACAKFEKMGYNLGDEAEAQLENCIKDLYNNRDPETWGNAREMENLYQAVILRHAQRCMAEGVTSEDIDVLITIEPEDIPVPNVENARILRPQKIGFR